MRTLLAVFALAIILLEACTGQLSEKATQPAVSQPPTSQPVFLPPKVLASPEKAVDLVLVNGEVITVDAKDSIVQAVAVKNGKILKVGTSEQMAELIGAETEVLDLKGKTVTPGLIDAHVHPDAWFRFDSRLMDFTNMRTKAAVLDAIAAAVKEKKKDEWISARPIGLAGGGLPNRMELDAVSPDNPVFLSNFPFTLVALNSRALTIAGITRTTPNPYGGVIEKDANGEPTGILRNTPASSLVRRYVPGIGGRTIDDWKNVIEQGVKQSVSEGKTYLRDAKVDQYFIEHFKQLGSEDKLTAGIAGYIYITSLADATDNLGKLDKYSGGSFKVLGIKLQLDGVMTGDALMYDNTLPTSKSAYAYFSQSDLNSIVSMYNKNGWQVTIHVWGDKATDMAIDAIEAALHETPRSDHRHTLEHVIYPTRQALERIKKLGIIVSAQPNYISLYGSGLKSAVNDEIAGRIMPLKTMIDMGIPLAFGTDNPETPDLSSKWGFIGSVNRVTYPLKELLNPNERITIQQALRCYTMGSAYACFQEKVRGSIEEGKIADMVVWSHDLYSLSSREDWLNLKAEITMIGGKVAYKADGCNLSLVKGSELVLSR
jgi:predicted amidohydrolase YtcJ